ncbi:HD domain-containing protein [Leptolyngbya sp. FACHB-261]|uniref:HD domain-containing protein n=1 Tax=Leptolyngbya sp. FACHB-261 TaxID=2692806 RepID=UPI001687C5D9|nr:HD domain-containing protein [Leptolyngbya sp. FACHB-261]MBD2099506.1 HD domain-containing protein [Leptolyngbya sp. FACHB-261]
MPSSRTYHDPLHGAITLHGSDPVEALLIELIDTPAFQRLRRIRQLDVASFTFHGAEGSRFTHSLGAMAVTRRAFDRLAKVYPELLPHRMVVLCGGLLHDIGHSPFSHAGEEFFDSHHELWTCRIVQESAPVRQALDQAQPGLADQLVQLYHKTYTPALAWQLVSSQLDCDRLDYLLRDSYFTGAQYGRLDLDRILMALGYDPETQRLVVRARKGLSAIEHYLVVRYFMYTQVYNHPKNLTARFVLGGAFRRAQVLLQQSEQGTLEADSNMRAWLQSHPDQLPLEQYLNADDVVFGYHIHRWQHHPDPILADLCRRYQDRDLLKAWDLSDLSNIQQHQVLEQVQRQLSQQGFDPHYYSSIRTALTQGYTLYRQGIELRTEQGTLREISELSPLVKTLIQPQQRAWLLYPREAKLNLEELVGS